MYERRASGWLKHYDFILLDLFCLQEAFALAYLLRYEGFQNLYENPIYRSMAIFLMLSDIAVIFFMEPFRGVLHRGYYREFVAAARQGIFLVLIAALYLFTVQDAISYSRTIFYLTGVIYILLAWFVRSLWKIWLRRRMAAVSQGEHRLVVLTDEKIASAVLAGIAEDNHQLYENVGVIILDRDLVGTKIGDVPVVASEETAISYICGNWIDEVLVVFSKSRPTTWKLIDDLIMAGITVHLNLARIHDMPGKKQAVERMGNYTVLTTSLNFMTPKQILGKRLLDLAGGIVGCMITGLLYLIVAPVIKIQSPGPVFFSQIRVGKNGRKFKMYKFRTMYPDAEERKKELMAHNRVKDGMMFKMDFDPRVIGNRILPDGTRKTGFMDFCRRYSIDEFPQFFNVLKGDMSLVGTRPPTLEEVEKYSVHHYARLATKPGITGLWQVSGRSDITDFEEVVRLDTKYITEWSMGLDIRILLKTIRVMFRGEGAM